MFAVTHPVPQTLKFVRLALARTGAASNARWPAPAGDGARHFVLQKNSHSARNRCNGEGFLIGKQPYKAPKRCMSGDARRPSGSLDCNRNALSGCGLLAI